jgi:hypothetical protein
MFKITLYENFIEFSFHTVGKKKNEDSLASMCFLVKVKCVVIRMSVKCKQIYFNCNLSLFGSVEEHI